MVTYLTCGFCYTIYTFNKILENKQPFLMMIDEEIGFENLKNFVFVLMLTSFIAWPIMIMNEIKNKRDL